MWFRDIDVPDHLVAAHREGRLVLFVGAGASIDSPSDLPTFVTLTEQIAKESGLVLGDPDRARPDQFLGDLDLDGRIGRVDVHRRVAEHIGSPASQPNDLHRAIAELALSMKPLRVVTTNYDLHLSSCLPDIKEFDAPALPIGDDFEGLVYLHGALRNDPRFLVVTSRDFGRAYLTDAWAARFLERMFRRFAVLFVGYSHDDVVMSYLAHGLPRESDRYVLTHEPDEDKWIRLGIKPIRYPVTPSGSHEAVGLCLDRWAERNRWGLLDHERLVKDLVSKPPSLVPEEQSYLEDVIADPNRVRLFAQHARSVEWLRWIEQRPEFQQLFDPQARPGDSASVLARWFAGTYLPQADTSAEALSVLNARGGQISEALWFAVAQQLQALGGPRPSHLGSWLALLLDSAPRRTMSLLDYALHACQWPQDRDAALLLFEYLTSPTIGFDRFSSYLGRPGLSVAVRGQDHWLAQAWREVLEPNLSEVAVDLISIFDQHIRSAHRMLVVAGSADSTYDPLSSHRPAIEKHGQNSSGGIDDLIDVGRDTLTFLLRTEPEVGAAYLQTWARSSVPLLRRLSVHGWSERDDVAADEKLGWLLNRGGMYDRQVQHEAFQLIARALPTASDDVARRVVATAQAGPTERTEFTDYDIYNHLVWLARARPDFRPGDEALAAAQLAHPEFGPREHPDFESWHEVGSWGPQTPMDPDELHDAIGTDASAALVDLVAYHDQSSPFDGPTWHDALGLLTATVQQWPNDGHDALAAMPDTEVRDELIAAIAEGWARGDLDEAAYLRVAAALSRRELIEADVGAAARFLRDQAKNDREAAWAQRSPAARALASDVWQVGTADDTLSSGIQTDDSLSRAINFWAGRVAQFWVQSISSEWTADTDAWSGLPDPVKEAIEPLLDGDTEAHAMAQVVLAANVNFLFGADADWTTSQVLPLLDWDRDPDTAARCWDAYAKYGRFTDRLLEAGLLDLYLNAIPNLDRLPESARESFCGHLASVALQSEIDPEESGWLRRFTASADEGLRAEWMRQVSRLLSELNTELAESAWSRWMLDYWQGRLDSVPVALTDLEASAISEWVTALDSSFVAGVQLALAHVAGLQEHTSLIYGLPKSRLISDHPAAVARLVAHLLQGTQGPFYDSGSLQQLVVELRSRIGEEGVEPIVEQAVRLGILGATSW
jgi:hypothetical protein